MGPVVDGGNLAGSTPGYRRRGDQLRSGKMVDSLDSDRMNVVDANHDDDRLRVPRDYGWRSLPSCFGTLLLATIYIRAASTAGKTYTPQQSTLTAVQTCSCRGK
jgi:hypothetical protein